MDGNRLNGFNLKPGNDIIKDFQQPTNMVNVSMVILGLLNILDISVFTRLCSKNEEGKFDWLMQSFVRIFVFIEYVNCYHANDLK